MDFSYIHLYHTPILTSSLLWGFPVNRVLITGFYSCNHTFSGLCHLSCRFSNLDEVASSQCGWGNKSDTSQTFFGKSVWQWGSCRVLRRLLVTFEPRNSHTGLLSFQSRGRSILPRLTQGQAGLGSSRDGCGQQSDPLPAPGREWGDVREL